MYVVTAAIFVSLIIRLSGNDFIVHSAAILSSEQLSVSPNQVGTSAGSNRPTARWPKVASEKKEAATFQNFVKPKKPLALAANFSIETFRRLFFDSPRVCATHHADNVPPEDS